MINENLKSLWEESANLYSNHVNKYITHKRITQLLLSSVVKTPSRILDFGCGPGNSTNIIHNMYPNSTIVAIDYAREMIEIAKNDNRNEKIHFVVGEVEALKEAPFDLIICSNSFFHVENKNNFLRSLSNLMNDNSVMLFSMYEFVIESIKEALPYSHNIADSYITDVITELNAMGYKIKRREENREKFTTESLQSLFNQSGMDVDFAGLIKLNRSIDERCNFFKLAAVGQEVFGNLPSIVVNNVLDSVKYKKEYANQERIVYAFSAKKNNK